MQGLETTELRRRRTPAGAAYVTAGRGEPLVLVHGVGLRLESWAPQIAAFSATHQVIAVDLPGHGESAPLAGSSCADAALPDYVDWLARVVDAVGCAPANVVGHSMGALVALGLAVTRPELVARVALLNAVHERSAAARAAVERRAEAIACGEVDVDGPLARWFAPHPDPAERALRERVRDWLARVDREGYAAAYRAFAHGDRVYAGALGTLECPALFLTGALDGNSTPAMSEAMAGRARHGRAVSVAGQRHLVGLVAPGPVEAELRRWLGEPAGPSAGTVAPERGAVLRATT